MVLVLRGSMTDLSKFFLNDGCFLFFFKSTKQAAVGTQQIRCSSEELLRESLTHFRYKLHSGLLYNLVDPYPTTQNWKITIFH